MTASTTNTNTIRNIGLAIAMAAYILSIFHRVAPAVISQDLQLAFHVGATQLGNLAATYFYVYTVMQIPIGVMADTLGPRRILTWGGLIAAAGAFLFALAPSFELAFVGRALTGLGVSVTFIAALKLIAVGFPEGRFATMVGVLMFLGNMGAVVGGAPLAWLAQNMGWQAAFYLVATLSLVLGLCSHFWVADIRRPASAAPTRWLSDLAQLMRNPRTWPGFFLNLGVAGTLFGFAGLWEVPYLTQVYGLSKALAANHVSLSFFGLAVGSFFWGSVSDALQRRKPVALTGASAYLALWLTLLLGGHLPLWASYAVCFGMGFCAACFTMSWACAKEVNPPLLSGMATSVVNVGVFLGSALMQPLFGWMIEWQWDGRMEASVRLFSAADFNRGMGLMLATASVGWLACWFIKETGCRNIYEISK
ncbi:MAG TPA: MFS transporter [Rhodocyclaceae bacterium]|nr:MFS transporter [Rhodocyclaceae bacterium]